MSKPIADLGLKQKGGHKREIPLYTGPLTREECELKIKELLTKDSLLSHYQTRLPGDHSELGRLKLKEQERIWAEIRSIKNYLRNSGL